MRQKKIQKLKYNFILFCMNVFYLVFTFDILLSYQCVENQWTFDFILEAWIERNVQIRQRICIFVLYLWIKTVQGLF